jgi:hypothetical protein
MINEVRQRLRAWSHLLADVTTPQLVHWDVGRQYLYRPRPSQINDTIDFERALWGDPLKEFQFRALEEPRAFASGYRRPMLETPRAPACAHDLPVSDHGHRVHLPAVFDAGAEVLGASNWCAS